MFLVRPLALRPIAATESRTCTSSTTASTAGAPQQLQQSLRRSAARRWRRAAFMPYRRRCGAAACRLRPSSSRRVSGAVRRPRCGGHCWEVPGWRPASRRARGESEREAAMPRRGAGRQPRSTIGAIATRSAPMSRAYRGITSLHVTPAGVGNMQAPWRENSPLVGTASPQAAWLPCPKDRRRAPRGRSRSGAGAMSQNATRALAGDRPTQASSRRHGSVSTVRRPRDPHLRGRGWSCTREEHVRRLAQ